MQLHPYIINLIAENQIAEIHARAESDRLARIAARERRAAKRASRDHVLRHRVLAHQSGWTSPQHAVHAPVREESQLVSVGRAGSDDCR